MNLIKEILNLKPEDFNEVRKAMVERRLCNPTLKELVKFIFDDLEKKLGETTVSIELRKKYKFIVKES